ncbi:MAG: hypothetical protein KKE36_00755, partial [Actinobacteria bacterium]|nr:hypothetical protein [Actinomycetota bacterium]
MATVDFPFSTRSCSKVSSISGAKARLVVEVHDRKAAVVRLDFAVVTASEWRDASTEQSIELPEYVTTVTLSHRDACRSVASDII